MIDLQQKLFAALAAFSGLNAFVGTRIYPRVAPQGVARPFCVWQQLALQQPRDLNGSAESGGLNNFQIQITSWAEDPKGATQAFDVDAQVRAAMISGFGSKSTLTDSRSLSFEADTKLHGVQSDFSVWMKT